MFVRLGGWLAGWLVRAGIEKPHGGKLFIAGAHIHTQFNAQSNAQQWPVGPVTADQRTTEQSRTGQSRQTLGCLTAAVSGAVLLGSILSRIIRRPRRAYCTHCLDHWLQQWVLACSLCQSAGSGRYEGTECVCVCSIPFSIGPFYRQLNSCCCSSFFCLRN